MFIDKLKVAAALGLAIGSPVTWSDVGVASGTGTLKVSNYVDFQIIIPQALFFRVGTGSAYSTAAPGFVIPTSRTVDLIAFAPSAAQVGSGTSVTGTGGDLGGGTETAAIIGNAGAVTITASETGAMTTGGANSADSIPWSQIHTAVAVNTSSTTLPAPVLGSGTQTVIANPPAKSKVVALDAKWNYSYVNSVTPAAGTYGGAGTSTGSAGGTNNGRVIYTASTP